MIVNKALEQGLCLVDDTMCKVYATQSYTHLRFIIVSNIDVAVTQLSK